MKIKSLVEADGCTGYLVNVVREIDLKERYVVGIFGSLLLLTYFFHHSESVFSHPTQLPSNQSFLDKLMHLLAPVE